MCSRKLNEVSEVGMYKFPVAAVTNLASQNNTNLLSHSSADQSLGVAWLRRVHCLEFTVLKSGGQQSCIPF